MELKELNKYNFHDSLLENITYDKEKNKVILEIDLCNWKQLGYGKKEQETKIIYLIFKGVFNVVIPDDELSSNEIIEFKVIKDNGIKIVILNDDSHNCCSILLNAKSVKITEETVWL